MISAKLFNTEEELQLVGMRLHELGVHVDLYFENTVVCEINDHITSVSVYLVASLKQGLCELKGYFMTEERDYLIDCGIRMIINYLYNLGHETVVFLLECKQKVLEKCCRKIGLNYSNVDGDGVQYSLSAADFYKSLC